MALGAIKATPASALPIRNAALVSMGAPGLVLVNIREKGKSWEIDQTWSMHGGSESRCCCQPHGFFEVKHSGTIFCERNAMKRIFCKAGDRPVGHKYNRAMGLRELAHRSTGERLDVGWATSRTAAFLVTKNPHHRNCRKSLLIVGLSPSRAACGGCCTTLAVSSAAAARHRR